MTNNMNTIDHCEVCGSRDLLPVLNLGAHPMCDDLVPVGNPRQCSEYPIEILYCQNCRTAHQKYQVPKTNLFPETYHYRSRFTADVLRGMQGLVESCEASFGTLQGKNVLDVGCNDGSLLDFFRERKSATFGIEPTGAWKDAAAKGHVIINDYLTPNVARDFLAKHGNPDFIVFTNVFAHIEDLKSVIESLNILKKPDTRIIIENHYLGAVLDGNQFDTFYHEHPRTYSYRSFEFIARDLGLQLVSVDFPSRYGGNIRVYMGPPSQRTEGGKADAAAIDAREEKFFDQFASMRNNIARWQSAKSKQLHDLNEKFGKLEAKAFPGRAAILIKLLNLSDSQISRVYEKPGSMKIGNYLPGTRIPIHSDEELLKKISQVPILLNLAWHIPAEIRNYLTEQGFKGQIIDILSPEDFKA